MRISSSTGLRSVLFLSLLCLFFCQFPKPQAQAQCVIEGKIEVHPDWQSKVFLVQPGYFKQIASSYEGKLIDSCTIDANGQFKLTFTPAQPEPALYGLYVQKNGSKYVNRVEFLPHQTNFILLELQGNDHVSIEAPIEHFNWKYRFTTETTPANQALEHLRDVFLPFYERAKEEAEKEDPESKEIQYAHDHNDSLSIATWDALERWIDTCQRTLPALAGVRLHSSDNSYFRNPELFVRLRDRLLAQTPVHPFAQEYASYCSSERLPLIKGERIPEFNLPDQDSTFHTPDALRGQLILLDFWASWCAPCRKEIREVLQPLHIQYADKGFQIVGFSIDSSKPNWLKAIERDKAHWLQLCDLEGDSSPIRESLKFQMIPANYLLDSEGRLLARNVHGEELEQIVRDFFDAGGE
jgi:thiol-disulfide isomerase/thioredoxin